MPTASGCPQAPYKDQPSPSAPLVEDRQVFKQGNHRVSKGKPPLHYTLGMQVWSCCTMSFLCCNNWLVTFPLLLEVVSHKLCVKWPRDYGSKWHQVEIFIQSTSEKEVLFCTQRHQLKQCRKPHNLFSSQTIAPRQVKKILKSNIIRKKFLKNKISTQTQELQSRSGKSCLPLFCPNSKSLLCKHKYLLKVPCLSQWYAFQFFTSSFYSTIYTIDLGLKKK